MRVRERLMMVPIMERELKKERAVLKEKYDGPWNSQVKPEGV